MQIIMKPVGDLIPYENNPRNNEAAIDYVAASISEFGFKVPLVIDADNIIVAGHTRLEAAKSLGLEEVPCIIADDLTEEQIRAYRLVDNKVAEFSKWDDAALEVELAELDNLDMSAFGFLDPDEDVDLDEFFLDDDTKKEKEPKRVQCPHCGEWFEP